MPVDNRRCLEGLMVNGLKPHDGATWTFDGLQGLSKVERFIEHRKLSAYATSAWVRIGCVEFDRCLP